ncbi:hypothetical protein ASPZODRAFT_85982, partial [Penicilliopsis zonata CBS 506.65]
MDDKLVHVLCCFREAEACNAIAAALGGAKGDVEKRDICRRENSKVVRHCGLREVKFTTQRHNMPPPTLSYGLNLPNKKPLGRPAPGGQKRKKTIFDSDSEDEQRDDGNGAEQISTLGGLESSQPAARLTGPPAKRKPILGGKPTLKPLGKNSVFADPDEEENGQMEEARAYGLETTKKEYTNLSALHSSKKHAQEAQDVDPSIYSYDAVYDSLHAKAGGTAASQPGSKTETPRYMTNLLRSAEIRKRDQMRARDRLLAKEREAEGDEFADKEKFVTAAYKKQQEEIRRLEAEEEQREKEEEERRRRNGGAGMVGFYRDMLARGEQRHEEVVKAAEEASRRVQAGEVQEAEREEREEEKEAKAKSQAQVAAELNARGANIAVNDEGQVVDKRQLLTAGLNVAPKPKQAVSSATSAAASASAGRGVGRTPRGAEAFSSRAAQRARQTEMIASQLEAQAQQTEQAETAARKELAERNRSQKTEGDVSSARERYLARKREREAAK